MHWLEWHKNILVTETQPDSEEKLERRVSHKLQSYPDLAKGFHQFENIILVIPL